MGHTYTRLLIHYVFSTKERRPLLREAVSDGVNAYFSGIASRQKMHLLRAGGVEDHRHLLVPGAMPASLCRHVDPRIPSPSMTRRAVRCPHFVKEYQRLWARHPTTEVQSVR